MAGTSAQRQVEAIAGCRKEEISPMLIALDLDIFFRVSLWSELDGELGFIHLKIVQRVSLYLNINERSMTVIDYLM